MGPGGGDVLGLSSAGWRQKRTQAWARLSPGPGFLLTELSSRPAQVFVLPTQQISCRVPVPGGSEGGRQHCVPRRRPLWGPAGQEQPWALWPGPGTAGQVGASSWWRKHRVLHAVLQLALWPAEPQLGNQTLSPGRSTLPPPPARSSSARPARAGAQACAGRDGTSLPASLRPGRAVPRICPPPRVLPF